MRKSLMIAGLVSAALLSGAAPGLAARNNGGGSIDASCTLNPFNHTIRCYECSKQADGTTRCDWVIRPQARSMSY